MNLKEKIAIMQSAERGEPVEVRSKHYLVGFTYRSEWGEIYNRGESASSWNFHVYDYRLKPSDPTGEIDKLARDNFLDEDDLRATAALARLQRRYPRDGTPQKFQNHRPRTEIFTVTFYKDGSVTFGCKAFSWDQVDAYAKAKGFWK